MLHLEIQKGEEATKMPIFQKDLGGNIASMKRLIVATKECVQLTSNETYFSDIWFSEEKTVEETMALGVDYYQPVRTSHKGFGLAKL